MKFSPVGRLLVFLLIWISFAKTVSAQVADRYPVIQCPTETSVTIAWRTSNSSQSTLKWGNSPGALSNVLTDTSAIQKHFFQIDQLNPNTQYFYQVDNGGGDTSAVEYFYTAKPYPIDKTTFLHYGDCGYNNGMQNKVAALMEQEDADFAVVAGDVDQGDGSNYDDIFFGVYKNMLSKECHYTAIGNHDIIYDNGSTYLDAFYLPTNNPQQSEHYYSFTWGKTKFICLNSNIDYSPGSDQHNFLLDELKCNDHEWVFVFFHHPPWTNAWDPLYYVPFQPYYEYDGNDDMRTKLVPYFEQYGVDFVLNGHSHCYQRGELNGVQYVISGGAGATTLDQRTCNTFPNYNSCSPNLQVEIYDNHYVRFEVNGDTARYWAVNDSGRVFDSLEVTKTWTNFQITMSSTPPTGPTANDGSATVVVQGPHPPYTFKWDNGDTSSTATKLDNGWVYVTITNGNGCEKMDSVYVGTPVSNQFLELETLLTVFPNPFEDQLQFDWKIPGEFEIRLTDLNGKVLIDQIGKGTTATIQTDGLSKGIYFYQIRVNGNFMAGKVIRD